MLRALTFGVACGALLFGFSLGDSAEAAKARGPARCMEAITPKCTAPQFVYCEKKNKCGACAKWSCRTPGTPRIM